MAPTCPGPRPPRSQGAPGAAATELPSHDMRQDPRADKPRRRPRLPHDPASRGPTMARKLGAWVDRPPSTCRIPARLTGPRGSLARRLRRHPLPPERMAARRAWGAAHQVSKLPGCRAPQPAQIHRDQGSKPPLRRGQPITLSPGHKGCLARPGTLIPGRQVPRGPASRGNLQPGHRGAGPRDPHGPSSHHGGAASPCALVPSRPASGRALLIEGPRRHRHTGTQSRAAHRLPGSCEDQGPPRAWVPGFPGGRASWLIAGPIAPAGLGRRPASHQAGPIARAGEGPWPPAGLGFLRQAETLRQRCRAASR
jgi:hypothetical protein